MVQGGRSSGTGMWFFGDMHVKSNDARNHNDSSKMIGLSVSLRSVNSQQEKFQLFKGEFEKDQQLLPKAAVDEGWRLSVFSDLLRELRLSVWFGYTPRGVV